MGFFRKKTGGKKTGTAGITVITHSGIFHPDDVFAAATICLAFKVSSREIAIIRTRDEKTIADSIGKAFILDVGGRHDEVLNFFDHHQAGGAGKREDATPYASFGLVWKRYGAAAVRAERAAAGCADDASDVAAGAAHIDESLVSPLDATDNGQSVIIETWNKLFPYTIQDAVFSYIPTWEETQKKTPVQAAALMDERFAMAVEDAICVLKREIQRTMAKFSGARLVEAVYTDSADKRLIVLGQYLPWKDALLEKPEPFFVVMPDADGMTWRAHAVPLEDSTGFERKKLFPEAWAGKRDAELAAITGVPDAIFCHNGRFICGARSKEGTIALAQLALL